MEIAKIVVVAVMFIWIILVLLVLPLVLAYFRGGAAKPDEPLAPDDVERLR